MSWAESSSEICPPVQSTHSMRNWSPGFTQATMGMSGCQRLCRTSCFVGGALVSTRISVSILPSSLGVWLVGNRAASDRKQFCDGLLVDVFAGGLVHEA